MTGKELPASILTFLAEHIDSVAKLDVLLLLAKNSSRTWTKDTVSQELRSSEFSAVQCLSDLTASGLLHFDGQSYRFAPKRAEQALLVTQLIQAYSNFPTRVVQVIYEKPDQRLRSFADAFRLRKDDDDSR